MNEFVARLSRLDSCAVSDALDKLGLQGSVTGIERFSTDRRITGQVLTVKLDRAEGRTNTKHLCTTAIDAAKPGDIIVVEQRTGLDAASWGGNLSIGAQVRGVAGVIVEGPARDIDDSRKLDFPVFARTHTPFTARQGVPLAKPSAGQAAVLPEQFSATSQTPPTERQVTVELTKESAGQEDTVPLQVSAVSQTSAAPRQVVEPVRNWQVEVLQQTPLSHCSPRPTVVSLQMPSTAPMSQKVP